MKPRFGSGLLFDNVDKTSNNKYNGTGVINVFLAWAFPCFRQATALISLFNLKKTYTYGELLLTKLRETESRSISKFRVISDKANSCSAIVVPLSLKFDKVGSYYIKAILDDYKSILNIPFVLDLQKWPIFSQSERHFVKEHGIPSNSIRANVHCQKCSHVYVLQESILGEAPPGGVEPFPDSGIFTCSQCNETIYVKDIQGQLRFSLKQMLANIIKDTK